eukprot:TRINITY_DN2272_c0_g10_i1.p1 TRINITY_DN2272_c0_g10~~TRINITY_DN2272_c0_g10_i1.p1  ORF type:complete len:124 (-),score=26.12 TRINITY_DN2272_c0_g10_i1:47-418(-)
MLTRLSLLSRATRAAPSNVRTYVDPTYADGAGWDKRRRCLKVRSWQRGWKENAMMVGSFADHNLVQMTDHELDLFDQLMEEGDNDIFSWITKQKEVPEEFRHEVMEKLQKHVATYKFTRNMPQ